jgi:hypothetical protein
MGQQLIRQPNGLLCFFSSVTDSINGFDFTPEDYIEQEIKREAFDTAVRVYQKALKVYAGQPAYHQFTMDWEEAAHPPPCDCGQCHNCAGFPPCDCGDYAPCAEAEPKKPDEETAGWIANIEKGRRADGEDPPAFKPLELKRAKMCDSVIGVYLSGRLVGFVAKYSFSEGWYWETLDVAYPGKITKGVSFLNAVREVRQHGR